MRKKKQKVRCEKRTLSKAKEVIRTYDSIQSKYADVLQENPEIKEIRCNVLLDGLEEGDYTSDFVCIKTNGDMLVRECVFRKYLMKPMTVKLLDISRDSWLKHGVVDGDYYRCRRIAYTKQKIQSSECWIFKKISCWLLIALREQCLNGQLLSALIL